MNKKSLLLGFLIALFSLVYVLAFIFINVKVFSTLQVLLNSKPTMMVLLLGYCLDGLLSGSAVVFALLAFNFKFTWLRVVGLLSINSFMQLWWVYIGLVDLNFYLVQMSLAQIFIVHVTFVVCIFVLSKITVFVKPQTKAG